jgi:hypothetical protein
MMGDTPKQLQMESFDTHSVLEVVKCMIVMQNDAWQTSYVAVPALIAGVPERAVPNRQL